MNPIKDVTIIIPTRANLEYLKMAINSIRAYGHYDTVKILVGADAPTDEVRKWLENNSKGMYDFKIYEPSKNEERMGIVNMVEDLVSCVNTKFVFYMHDDMVIGKNTLQKLMDSWTEKTVLSAFRVEPPLYPQSPEKLILPLGMTPEEFDMEKFLDVEKKVMEQEEDEIVEGFFAPHFFATEDWIGYDHLFEPQSREDSDLAQRFMDEGFKLLTIRDAVVYHFSGKGSRKKSGQDDSSEWQQTNYKNTCNYIRKWKTLDHTKYILPQRVPDIPITATVLVGDEDPQMFFNFIKNVEPWFEEIVFVLDKNGDEKNAELKQVIESYSEFQKSLGPTNFDKNKFKTFERSLDGDFASQTNYATEQATNDWVIKLDVDEVFPIPFLSGLRKLIKQIKEENPNACVIGFPRINLLDGKISNDIPRQHWFTEDFDKYPAKTEGVNNPDTQYRLHEKKIKWVNKVHEVPEPVKQGDPDRVAIAAELYFEHPKDRKRQYIQEQKYQKIMNKKIQNNKISKYIYDSVIFTHEGITKHAREEIKELLKRDNNVWLLDQNYRPGFDPVFETLYTPFDLEKQDYVTIVNQPPVRWEKTQHIPNRIGYLAFEGLLPENWVKIINESNIVALWTPSEYCKEMFKKSGVTKPIDVVPHGVNPDVWKPKDKISEKINELKTDQFTFLACGTFHNNRKGFDLLTTAFCEEFTKDEDVRLLFKVNKIYNPQDSFIRYISQYINEEGNTNIEYIDEIMSEEELVDLFNLVDVYVSPHRSEGFGINILNAHAAGTPVVCTGATGNMDFCNKKNSLLIDVEERERWSPFIPPYDRAKWPEPTLDSIKKMLRKAYNDHEALKKRAVEKISPDIREKWSWKAIIDAVEQKLVLG